MNNSTFPLKFKNLDDFKDHAAYLATELAPMFPDQGDPLARLSDIYLDIIDAAETFKGTNFDSFVTNKIYMKYSKFIRPTTIDEERN